MTLEASDSTAPLSSTPPRASSSQAIFSDENERRDSSPPSSPPGFPWEKQKEVKTYTSASSSPAPTFANVFSVLGKRKALDATTDNARATKQKKVATVPRKENGMTQMQMSLGQTVQKRCKTCGMTYTASSAEDRKLHDKYHKQNLEGYDVGKTFVEKTAPPRYRRYAGLKSDDAIVFLDCHDHGMRKKKGQAVLEIVQRELGAVPIPEDQIWEMETARTGNGDETKYAAYMYIRGTKCVGFLLVQSIQEGLEVERPKDLPEPAKNTKDPTTTAKVTSSVAALKARKQQEEQAAQVLATEIAEASKHSIQLSSKPRPAVLGVSRIWTSPTARGQGIAIALLNIAVKRHNELATSDQKDYDELMAGKSHNGKMRLEQCQVLAKLIGKIRRVRSKSEVAFSQPTEAGAKLARKWNGRAYGWSVYVD